MATMSKSCSTGGEALGEVSRVDANRAVKPPVESPVQARRLDRLTLPANSHLRVTKPT
jgi:hypothetical protein